MLPVVFMDSQQVLCLLPTIQNSACGANWELWIVHRCQCKCEWLFVCLCGLAVNCQRVQGLTPPPPDECWDRLPEPPVTLSARGAVTGNGRSASESVIHILASGQVHHLLFFLLLFFQMMHLLTQHPPLSQKLKFQSNNSYWPLNRVITEVVLLYRWQCAFCFSLQIPSLMVSCSRHQAHCMFTNDKWQTLLFRARKGIRFTKACGLQRLRAQGPPL